MAGRILRREFLAAGLGAAGACLAASFSDAAADLGAPVDFHVHLDNSTIGQVLELSVERGVKFGVVEHAGTKENQYPVVLSNDAELERWLAGLAGRPVYRGVQAEWSDWWHGFSPAMLARLDFVLTDVMTFPGKDGRRVKLWEKDVEARVEMSDREAFMERFVDWHVEIIRRQPIDILANFSWLPKPLADEYDRFWTRARMGRVVGALAEERVAMEISSCYSLPKRPFLEMARAAGVKFSFGSNGRYPKMGLLDYSLQTARDLGLTKADLFTPWPAGQKAIERMKRG